MQRRVSGTMGWIHGGQEMYNKLKDLELFFNLLIILAHLLLLKSAVRFGHFQFDNYKIKQPNLGSGQT